MSCKKGEDGIVAISPNVIGRSVLGSFPLRFWMSQKKKYYCDDCNADIENEFRFVFIALCTEKGWMDAV